MEPGDPLRSYVENFPLFI